jgi:hypothetical protein
MRTLDSIGLEYGTGKSSDVHDYLSKYEKYLPFNCGEKLKILEIGVLDGASLKMWKEYYSNSEIIGIDINSECKKYEEDRVKVEIGSQFDMDFLKYIVDKHGPFDMILDDGSHMNDHVIFSFKNLFDSIKSSGVYVIEDCFTSYLNDFGGGLLKENSIIEYFKKLSDDVNFRGLLNYDAPHVYSRREDWLIDLSKNKQPDCRVDVESINFLNGIIIVTKR